MKTAEQRCGETKGVEEQMLTEERMIKCSHKQANMFIGRQAGKYIRITSQMDREDGVGDENGLNSTCFGLKRGHFMQQKHLNGNFFPILLYHLTGIVHRSY